MFALDTNIKFLNLPKLDDDTKNTIELLAEKIQPDLLSISWLENFHNNNIRAASQVYARDSAILPDYLQQKIKQQFQDYFKIPITPIFGVFENINYNGAAECPPHCDRHRKIAINYIIKTGGSNVLTCFYTNKRIGKKLNKAENALYQNVNLDFKVRLPDQVWHTYDVQTYHSVENIENKRIILSLCLENNISYNSFIKSHRHLLYE